MTKCPGSLWLPSTNPRAHEHRAQFIQHRRTAAQHDAIGFQIETRKPDVRKKLSGLDEIGDAAAVAERLARHGRIIDELVLDQRAEQLVLAQALDHLLAISELGDLPAAMRQHDGARRIS